MHAKAAIAAEPPARPTMVLVHGLSVSHRYWRPTADRLRYQYDVWMPDLPGFGLSEKPQRSLTLPELASALADWMDVRKMGPTTLVGNSMGCQVIIELAVQRPDLVHKAVLTAPSIDPQRRSSLEQIWSGAQDLPYEPLKLLVIVFKDYLIAGPARTFRTLKFAVQDPILTKLPKVRAPMLVVRGESDRVASQAWVEEMARLLPYGRVVTIPNAAHGVIYSAPEALTEAIEAFITETDLQLAAIRDDV